MPTKTTILAEPHPLGSHSAQGCPCSLAMSPWQFPQSLCWAWAVSEVRKVQMRETALSKARHQALFLYFYIYCILSFFTCKCQNAEKTPPKNPQCEILRSLLQSIEKVGCNSVGIRNLLSCKYSEIAHPECLHKLRHLLKADFISESI